MNGTRSRPFRFSAIGQLASIGHHTGVAQMVVLLGSSSQPHKPADLCTLAVMTSLLGRAIEMHNWAEQLQQACRALDTELKAAAAVLMAVLRWIVHDEVDRVGISSPAAFLESVDSRLRALRLPERGEFVTAFWAVFDPPTGALAYSCAGHNSPRLLRVRDRTVIPLNGATSVPLGMFDEATKYTEEMVVLMPGDLAVLYTDGITEARSPAGEFFDVERLDQILRDLPDPITADGVIKDIAKAVATFAGDAAPADDQTLLALGGCPPLTSTCRSASDCATCGSLKAK